MTPTWRHLHAARNGGIDRIVARGQAALAELGLVPRRRSPWRAALGIVGAAAAGALLLAFLTRGGAAR